ncbi:protein kinase domain-containing protein [Nitrococcus mobilis]|uniref:Serine/threonine protein kinase n=1 Tax=Nitrococcus mobilis Nb-231 TaxID=314278 RepID=A4BV99_9GAMM|nr:protein kinase [Nitrococcus mobilis]EAR20366.1 serine/threonine protein kinase [Nitrococcus mobilis Nb-231]
MRAGEFISGYRLSSDGTTVNGGRCVWAFCTKNGKEFFIKQFLSPKYPVPGEAPGSEERKRKLKEKCERFEQQQNRVMNEFRQRVYTGGNLTVPIEFVRVGSFYYKIAPKIDTSLVDIDDIAKLPLNRRFLIAKTATRCLRTLHNMRIAHGDLKPSNILINKTEMGHFVAKLIDFDDSFFEGEINENPEEVVGDFVYYSPEMLRYIKEGGDDLRASVTCKSDIFALGIIYYQYFSGRLPAFNKSKYRYLAVSVLDGKRPGLGRLRLRNKKLTRLIAEMLSTNPNDRPSAMEILDELKDIDHGGLERGSTTRHSYTGQLKGTLITKTKAPPPSESRNLISGTGIKSAMSKWLKNKLAPKQNG